VAVVQLLEGRVVVWAPRYGRGYAVFLKILLATLLLDHTGEMGINSSYWPIYFVPVVTAATYFGPWGTLIWTALASAAYCSYLIPSLQEYAPTAEGIAELAMRLLFFFLAAMLVNRFAVEIQRRAAAYRSLAEQMAETNRRLAQAQEEARRSERLAALGQMSASSARTPQPCRRCPWTNVSASWSFTTSRSTLMRRWSRMEGLCASRSRPHSAARRPVSRSRFATRAPALPRSFASRFSIRF